MRVQGGVRRLRRKSSGSTTKETSTPIVQERQTSEGRLRRRRRKKKQESETFRHRSYLSARLMYSWLEQLAARWVDIMMKESMAKTCGGIRVSRHPNMMREAEKD